MIGESWDAFTRQVIFEKHISGIMCENPGPPCPSVPTPLYWDEKSSRQQPSYYVSYILEYTWRRKILQYKN